MIKRLGTIITLIAAGCGGGTPAPKAAFSSQHHDTARAVVAGLPGVKSAEVSMGDTGYVAAVVEVDPAIVTSPETFARDAVLAMRNAVYVMPGASPDWAYRVSVNGPSPGPGLVNRYGSARLSGSGLQWKPGA